MSYKLGLLLSLTFLMAVLFLAGDMMNLASVKASLDALGTVVSYRIASDGTVNESTERLISSYGATFRYEDGKKPLFRIGEIVTYYLEKGYDPFVVSKSTMRVSVKRSAVVGYYVS